MTQDEIIEMARQAGFDVKEWGDETLVRTVHSKGYFVVINQKLESFAKLVAADAAAKEREACAKVAICYDSEPWKHTPSYSHVADMVSVEIGKAIRARGQL